MSERMAPRTFWLGVAALTVLAAALRLMGLDSQPLTGDDLAVAESAATYVQTGHLGPIMWNHPPLRNLAVYGGLTGWDMTPFGLKWASVLLGVATVPLLAVVTQRLVGDPVVALVAAGLLAIDGLHVDFSRQAVHEVYNAAFGLGVVAAALRFHDTRHWGWLVLAGACLGLGLASKWGIVFPALVTVGFLLGSQPRDAARSLAICAVLAGVAGLIYTLSFLPVFARGLGFVDWVNLHGAMLHETRHHVAYNPFTGGDLTTNPVWWFLRPVGYADFSFEGRRVTVLVGLTNPAVWLLTLPALGAMAVRGYRERNAEHGLVVALFASTYLPFLLAGLNRPIWVHSAFAALTWALVAIGTLVTRLPRRVLGAYLVVVVALAVPLYWLAVGDAPEWLNWVVQMYRPSQHPPIEGV